MRPPASIAPALAVLATALSVGSCGGAAPARTADGNPRPLTQAQAPDPPKSARAGTSSATAPGDPSPAQPDTPHAASGAPAAREPGERPAGAPGGVAPAHPVPAAFRPAPGAPSDAEVREELAKMDAIQRHQRQLELSAAAANLAGLLPWSLEPKEGIRRSVASVFTDYGLGLACGGVLGRHELGVAHKTAPCGTLITFTYAGRSVTVPVIDRGPYIAGREWDLTGATAEALGFPGLGQIEWSLAG